MTTALIVVACVFTYFLFGGFTYRLAEKNHRFSCRSCDNEIRGRKCSGDPDIGWTFAALGWPFVIPMFIGMGLFGNSGVFDRTARRRQKELAEAQHQAELARLKAQEQWELDRQLSSLKKEYN